MFTIQKTEFGYLVLLNGIEVKLFTTQAKALDYVASLKLKSAGN